MRLLPHLVSSTLYFCTLNSQPLELLESDVVDHGHSASSLVARQAPAVVASSDFYRRAYHASAVVGNWIYIDGGEFSYRSNGNVTYQYSTTTLAIDLSKTWTNSTVQIQSNPKPDAVPNLIHPSLWYSEQDNVLYSGFAGRISLYADQPPPVELQLWSLKLDGAGGGSWNEVYGANNSAFGSITRPWRPMMAYGVDSAFVLGGTEDFLTTPETAAKLGGEVALPGLVQFNMTTKTFSNSSAAGYQTNGTAERGAMHYVPSFGPNGLYVVMGGDYIIPTDLRDFGTISIFDPLSKKWYQQATSGSIPKARVEFCTAGVNSTNGTYEIFMYAGWNGNLGAAAIAYDEAYVLTLPGFFWIKAKYPAAHPRHGLTCNAVGGSQILTIGGVDTDTTLTHGSSGLELDQATFSQSPDPFTQGLAIFDMTTLSFASQFTAPPPPYVQSDPVQKYYAQNITTNWTSPEVASLFRITHFTNATTPPNNNLPSTTNGTSATPTPSSSSSKTSVAGIAGGVVGGIVACVLIGVFSFFFIKRRRANRAAAAAHSDVAHGDYQNPPTKAKGFHEMYQQPPELAGGERDEMRAELPEQGMFELDAAGYSGHRGFYEPAKEPIGGGEHENSHDVEIRREPTHEAVEEPFHEQVREAVKKSMAQPPRRPTPPAANGEVSPLKSDISPVLDPAEKQSPKHPTTTNPASQMSEQVSPIEGGVSPFNDGVSPVAGPARTGLRKKSIRDKALPPEPARGT